MYLNLGWVGLTLFAIVILTGNRNVISAFHRDPLSGRLNLAYFVIALSYKLPTEVDFKMMNSDVDPVSVIDRSAAGSGQ